MDAASADRNLLLGIIALQMDFVSRDALIAAMNAWVLNKATALSQVLHDQGALNAGQRSLLDALVAEHIQLHGGDPQKSLAALSSIGSLRGELSRIADPDVEASLSHVSAVPRQPDVDPYRTVPQPSVGDSTSGGERFRILRPHAKGGLGEVFVARDTELNRDVALKEIQDQFADDPGHRARFEFEAEITGGLEHPGIVPVYGLGHTPDGRPFYAMRFIQGDSLRAAIRRFHEADHPAGRSAGQRLLALRGLLGRFLDVCDAVAYAHGRGVLHRDLKPGNIMLGRYGQTLVVDWGLAKAMDRTEEAASDLVAEPPLRPASGSVLEPTQPGSALGTPAYMSPEQAGGRLERLGPRSDVYCLGATLYHLLTGRAPCEGEEADEVYQKVLAGDIRRPRTVNPRIAPALEAVCIKAMAHQPEDRYASVEELQADLERWLADEPVSAWREPLPLRARRWMRRHRSAVTAATSILIVTTAGLGAALQRERINAERLGRAKAESDRRLDQTLQAVEDYYTGVSEEMLLGQSQFHDLRARLLDKPRQFYEQLTRELESASDARGRILLARGRYSLGRLMWLLGRHEEAMQQHEEVIKLYRNLVGAQPNAPKYQDYLGRSYVDLGTVQSQRGDRTAAASSFSHSIRIFHTLVAAQPNNPLYMDGLTCGYCGLGKLHYDQGDFKGATDSYRQAIQAASNLVALQPNVPLYQDRLALSYAGLGNVRRETGERREAEGSFGHAIAIGLKLMSEHPDLARYKDTVASCYHDLGYVQRDMQNLDGAAKSYSQAIKIGAELVEAQPNVPNLQVRLAWAYTDLGALQSDAGDREKARESYVQAIMIRSKLTEVKPSLPKFSLADCYNELGQLQRNTGQLTDASRSYEHARRILELLVKEHPENLEYKKLLAGTLTNIGVVDMAEGRRLQAINRFREALIYWKEPFAKNPKDPFYSRGVKEAPKALSNILRSKRASDPSSPAEPIPAKKPPRP